MVVRNSTYRRRGTRLPAWLKASYTAAELPDILPDLAYDVMERAGMAEEDCCDAYHRLYAALDPRHASNCGICRIIGREARHAAS